MPVQILGPFRQEYRLSALGTLITQPASDSVCTRARRSELHDAFLRHASVVLLPLVRVQCSAIAEAMKQQP
jgi:hypothetical protein